MRLWQWTAATMARAVASPARTQTPASRVCSPLARVPHLFFIFLVSFVKNLQQSRVPHQEALISHLRWPRGKSWTAFPLRLAGVAHSAFDVLPAGAKVSRGGNSQEIGGTHEQYEQHTKCQEEEISRK